jgi:hypothetical protein
MKVKAIVTEAKSYDVDSSVPYGVHLGLLGRDSELPTRMASG